MKMEECANERKKEWMWETETKENVEVFQCVCVCVCVRFLLVQMVKQQSRRRTNGKFHFSR